jgi:hypothetical protein
MYVYYSYYLHLSVLGENVRDKELGKVVKHRQVINRRVMELPLDLRERESEREGERESVLDGTAPGSDRERGRGRARERVVVVVVVVVAIAIVVLRGHKCIGVAMRDE